MIRIVTDSASDITPAEAKAMGVDLVPLDIRFPNHPYNPENDDTFDEFYRLLTTVEEFPKTSQPPPEAFARAFREAKQAGDSVLAVLISSGLSGTVQSARIALEAEGFENAHVVDTRCAIMPQRILVEQAVKLRNAGGRFADIVREIESLRDRVRVYGMIDTLTYLYKGGRLSKTVALAGNLLHIRPIITARDGVIKLIGRARGPLALLTKLSDPPKFDPAYPVYFGYTATKDNCQKLMTQALEQFSIGETGMFPIGGTVGAHVGPNGAAVAFVAAKA